MDGLSSEADQHLKEAATEIVGKQRDGVMGA